MSNEINSPERPNSSFSGHMTGNNMWVHVSQTPKLFLSRNEKESVFIGVFKCGEPNRLFFSKFIPCGYDIHEDVRGCFPMGELVARTFHILH